MIFTYIRLLALELFMSRKKQQILNYFGKTNASFLHARGKLATNQLIKFLDPQPKEKILEIGFGTGATLITLANNHKNIDLFGYELSEIMFDRASKRIHFCGFKEKISLAVLKEKHSFPEPDHFFDKIYVESVLAIQEKEELKKIFLEIKRVLKPNGYLVFNETIWLKTTKKETIKEINDFCKKEFGIIQANGEFPYIQNWNSLLFKTGFECEKSIWVSRISPNTKKTKSSFLSKLFTAFGKIKANNPSLKKQWSDYQTKISLLMDKYDKQLMEGIIIKAKKSNN